MAPLVDTSLIRVCRLTVKYASPEASASALDEVSLDIRRGEVIGILGESGSGKSTLALAILGMLAADTRVQGSIFFQCEGSQKIDLLQLNEQEWQTIRGAKISMIFQEPGLCLSPVMRVGDQIAEVLRAHRRGRIGSYEEQVNALLHRVHFADIDRIYHAYPHQLSGGELHRIAISQALACEPDLIIADEVTRSLDASLQAEVIELLRAIHQENGTAILFITHDPELLAGFADRIVVMYAGSIAENGPAARVLRHPLHPYARALLELAQSPIESAVAPRRLPTIPGSLSASDRLARGCVFESRCSARSAVCKEKPPELIARENDHQVSCFNYGS